MLRVLLAAVALLPANAGFDYPIGGDYRPAAGVDVVARDWFAGRPAGCRGRQRRSSVRG